MSWNNLKAGVNAIVKTNGNQEITGANMQNVLGTIIDSLGAYATFAGVAIPSTNPGVPDGPVFYIAGRQGRYSNFGNVRFDTANAFGVFVWDGTQWHLNVVELSISGGGGGGGGGDIDPSIAEFTQSRVTIKKLLYLNDDLILDDTLISGVAEFYATETYTGLITVDEIRKGSGTQQLAIEVYDPVLFDDNVSIRGFLDMDDVWIEDGAITCESITIGSGDNEVTIEDGVVSATGIDAAAISTSLILLDGSDLSDIIDGINAKIAGISRTVSSNVGTTTIGEDLVVSGGLSVSGGAMIGGNVNCDDIFCGLVEAAGFVTDDGLDIVAEIGAIKSAVATEVGDTATTAISEGSVIWHDNQLYRALSRISQNTQWANARVTVTSISAELLSLRNSCSLNDENIELLRDDISSLSSNKADKNAAVGSIANTTATANAVTMQYDDVLNSLKGTVTINNADATHAGVMTAAMFNKLDGIEAGAEKNIIKSVKVDDTALSPDANGAVNVQVKPLLGGSYPSTLPSRDSQNLYLPVDGNNYYLGNINGLGLSWQTPAAKEGITIHFTASSTFTILLPYDDGQDVPDIEHEIANETALVCSQGVKYLLVIVAVCGANGALVNIVSLNELTSAS